MAKLPFKKRMQDALAKFGVSNGTKIEDGAPPAGTNDDAAWRDKHAALRDLLRFKLMKDVGEKGYDDAKTRLFTAFDVDKNKLATGHEEMFVADNVACMIRVAEGRNNLNREKLISVLITDYKMSMGDVNAAIEKSMVKSAAAVYFTPSMVRE